MTAKKRTGDNSSSFGDLEQSFSNVSLGEEILKSEDVLAALVGNSPDMETLLANAKTGDKKALLALVKIHSNKHLVTDDPDREIISPKIFIDEDFITQDWVQEILHKNIDDQWFEKDLWDAVVSKLTGKWIQRTNDQQADLKRYIIFRKDAWNNDLKQKQITYEEIEEELLKNELIGDGEYDDPESLKKFLKLYGIGGGRPGRPKKGK
jgi:hypothetical protein